MNFTRRRGFFIKHFILLSFVLSLSATAGAEGGYCGNESVQKIERPFFAKNPAAGKFTYKFSYIKRDDPDATVLIFIPGGPGQTSMDMGLSLPDEFAVVRTDPRSVGCNQVEFPAESLTSEELARDVLAIVREIKPKRYILHGISYGTVVATMAAALAAEENVAPPMAVVLEGTMGRVYSADEYVKTYLKGWSDLKQKLPNAILKQFQGPKFPLGFTSKEWAAWVSSMLIYGITPAGDNLLKENLLRLNPALNDGERQSLIAQLKRVQALPTPEKIKLYSEIICRELVPDVRDVKFDFDFVNGDLVASSDRLCGKIPLSRPYDSAAYQIKAPIYYFSGNLDPATPPAHANYHFENQKGPKTLISVMNGGHQALSGNLMDCANEVWRAIEKNESLLSALSKCAQKDHIKIKTEDPKKIILSDFESFYQKVLKPTGVTLSIQVKEEGALEEANAYSNGTTMTITVSTAFLQSPRLTDDGLRFTLCHEMGHLLGGAPRRHVPFEWDGPTALDGLSLLSSEGEADYYATKVCFREIIKKQNQADFLPKKKLSARLTQMCESTWGKNRNEVIICERAGGAAYNMLQLTKDFEISFETPSGEVASEIIRDAYPARQCRLDTALAGALCMQKASLIFDFNNAELNGCPETQGARPSCWYKKP